MHILRAHLLVDRASLSRGPDKDELWFVSRNDQMYTSTIYQVALSISLVHKITRVVHVRRFIVILLPLGFVGDIVLHQLLQLASVHIVRVDTRGWTELLAQRIDKNFECVWVV